MAFVKRVREMERFPRGYGFAWVEWHTLRCVCLPVPINYVARYFRDWWYRVRRPQGHDLLDETWNRGHSEGYQRGSEAVYRRMEIAKKYGS